MSVLAISNLILWILQIAIIVVIVGLARQLGLLHLRLGPVGPGPAEGGPSIGAQFDLQPVASLRGPIMQLLLPGQISLIVFVNPTCSACAPTMQALKRVRAVEQGIHVTVAIEGEQTASLRYADVHGLADVATGADALQHLAAAPRPFATAMSDDGTVLASGIPNTVEQIEILLATARDRASRPHSPNDDAATAPEQQVIDNAHTPTAAQFVPLLSHDDQAL